MAEVKWIKIVTDIFDDEKILMIESLPLADSIIVIWFKLLCLAGKSNNSGVFLLNDKVPYSDEMLAAIFRRDLKTVQLALKTFEQFGMIEIINNTVTIPNWSKHQTLDSYEKKKERDRLYQQQRRHKQQLMICDKSSDKSSELVATSQKIVPLEEEKEIEEDKELNIDIYISSWNFLGLNKLISLKKGSMRYKELNARVKEFGEDKVLESISNIAKSKFLKGENDRGWIITFDWLVRPNNFIKVLEGNYTDKDKPKRPTSGGKAVSKFNNFEGREYDYDDLEKKLLGWDKEEFQESEVENESNS